MYLRRTRPSVLLIAWLQKVTGYLTLSLFPSFFPTDYFILNKFPESKAANSVTSIDNMHIMKQTAEV